MTRALIVVDVQNDFCEAGSMPVDGGGTVAGAITSKVGTNRGNRKYDFVVATKDWHVDPGAHFAAPDKEPDFVDTWPVHCVADSPGAKFHHNLEIAIDEIFLKGRTSASYTGFDAGASADESVKLEEWLRDRGVEEVDVVGLATDYCVKATALDSAAAGFHTKVLLDMCAGISADTTRAAMEEFREAGVAVV